MQSLAASFGCNTYSYTQSHTAADCLTHLARQGFREFELMMYPGHLWPADTDAAARKKLRQQIESLGVRLLTLNMPNIDMNIAAAAAEMRQHTLRLLKGIVELAGDLGAPGVVVGVGKSNPLFAAPKEQLTGYLFSALDELVPLAKKCGTALWVENMPFAFLPRIDELMAALDRYGNADIGIVWDAANSHFVKEGMGQSLRACRDRLKLVHLSDTNQKVYKHDAVGLGDVPFAEIPPVMAEIGHRGLAMLEIISHDADRDILASADKLAAMGFGPR